MRRVSPSPRSRGEGRGEGRVACGEIPPFRPAPHTQTEVGNSRLRVGLRLPSPRARGEGFPCTISAVARPLGAARRSGRSAPSSEGWEKARVERERLKAAVKNARAKGPIDDEIAELQKLVAASALNVARKIGRGG